MSARHGRLDTLNHFFHRHFLGLLLIAYALAAAAPDVGRAVGQAAVGVSVVRVSAPAAMLGFLLFVAGVGVRAEHLRGVVRRPAALGAGFLAGVVVPVLVVAAFAPLLALWHDPAEAAAVIAGLAVVAAMPVAGSSAGWTRAADGDPALSVGLVVSSTLFSPVTTPLALRAAAAVGAGDEVGRLAGAGGAGAFLAGCVVIPVVVGLIARWVVGGKRADAAGPALKPASSVILLLLCYTNASACLPAVAADPDWDFLALVVVAVGVLCTAGFAAGFGVALAVRADPAGRKALVFGVGMANNGAGLSLAAGGLAACPLALLPVVAANLVQHLLAGVATRRLEVAPAQRVTDTRDDSGNSDATVPPR
jgi:BASS family bile acid:Na+ symporter